MFTPVSNEAMTWSGPTSPFPKRIKDHNRGFDFGVKVACTAEIPKGTHFRKPGLNEIKTGK